MVPGDNVSGEREDEPVPLPHLHAGEKVRSSILDLPHGLHEYVKYPTRTWSKTRTWLNARWQLRACTRVGRWPRVHGHVIVSNHGEIVIGDQVQIVSHYARSVYTTFAGGRLEIGNRTFINYGGDISATKLVKIGADCMIGTHAIIIDNAFHDLTDRHIRPEARPVIIHDGVWIGNRAIILPGVTIGEKSVIGAGSVVTMNIPPQSLAAGNPARVIKTL